MTQPRSSIAHPAAQSAGDSQQQINGHAHNAATVVVNGEKGQTLKITFGEALTLFERMPEGRCTVSNKLKT